MMSHKDTNPRDRLITGVIPLYIDNYSSFL